MHGVILVTGRWLNAVWIRAFLLGVMELFLQPKHTLEAATSFHNGEPSGDGAKRHRKAGVAEGVLLHNVTSAHKGHPVLCAG